MRALKWKQRILRRHARDSTSGASRPKPSRGHREVSDPQPTDGGECDENPAAPKSESLRGNLVITHVGTLCRRIGWCIHLTRGLPRWTGNLREMTRVGDQKVLVRGKPGSAGSATMATSLRGHMQYDAN